MIAVSFAFARIVYGFVVVHGSVGHSTPYSTVIVLSSAPFSITSLTSSSKSAIVATSNLYHLSVLASKRMEVPHSTLRGSAFLHGSSTSGSISIAPLATTCTYT